MKIIQILLISTVIIFSTLTQASIDFTEDILPYPMSLATGVACSSSTYYLAHNFLNLTKKESLFAGTLSFIVSSYISFIIFSDIFNRQLPHKKLTHVLNIIGTIETDPIVTHQSKSSAEYFNFLRRNSAEENYLLETESILSAYAENILTAQELLYNIKNTAHSYDNESEYLELLRSIKQLQERLHDLTKAVESKKNIITSNNLFIQQVRSIV